MEKAKTQKKNSRFCTSYHEPGREQCLADGKMCWKCKGKDHVAPKCKSVKKQCPTEQVLEKQIMLEIIEKYNFVEEQIIIINNFNWVSKWIYRPSTLFFYI